MRPDEKRITIVAAAILTLGVVILGPIQGWPMAAWVPLCLVPPILGVLLARVVRRFREQQHMRKEFERVSDPPAPPPEPERPRQELLSDVSLRSSTPDYRFLLSATVYWIPNRSSAGRIRGNPAAMARESIVSRAAEVLNHERPDDHGVLSERLSAVLGTALTVPPGQIDAWGWDISVTLPDADQKRLHRLAEVRKEEEVWEHERNHERNVREYLSEDVLRDPGRAVVWWLARNTEHPDSGLHETVRSIDDLRRLTSAAHATDVPDMYSPGPNVPYTTAYSFDSLPAFPLHTTGKHGIEQSAPASDVTLPNTVPTPTETPLERLLSFTESVVAEQDADEQTVFVRRLAQLLDTHKHREAAGELRRHFRVDSYSTASPDAEDLDPPPVHWPSEQDQP